MFQEIMVEILRNVVPIRPERSNVRKMALKSNKYPLNQKSICKKFTGKPDDIGLNPWAGVKIFQSKHQKKQLPLAAVNFQPYPILACIDES
jgi:hypothetical protein